MPRRFLAAVDDEDVVADVDLWYCSVVAAKDQLGHDGELPSFAGAEDVLAPGRARRARRCSSHGR